MDSNDACEPGGKQCQQQDQGDHPLRRSILDTPRPPQQPEQARPDGKYQEQNPSDRAEYDVQRRDTRSIVYQRNAKSE